MFIFGPNFFLSLTPLFLWVEGSQNLTSECRPLDVVFLIDGSGSETNDSFRDQLEFMEEIVQTSGLYNKDTHFGAVSFSSKARLEFNLNQYSSSVDTILAIKKITQSGQFTRLENGFDFVTNISFTKDGGDRPDVDNVLIVMTDGIFHPENASEPAEILLGNGVKIVLILFTTNMTDRLTNNAQSITDLKNAYTRDTFEPLELFCPNTSTQSANTTVVVPPSSTGVPTTTTDVVPPLISTTIPFTTNPACRDKISRCASYGAEICTLYRSWAEKQCPCFCKFDQGSTSVKTDHGSVTQPTNTKIWITITNKLG
ncbi:collagen alpha-4(VI) chain-like [Crassostrea angulata]|uniref:collagen alpha-4(VI) chain-like n=1 Tax=Magallana angulata TaxID=2784310 RepID=UPI0022B12E3E|nr:collagen alpha-4(VI) chain-like [Crassostrea angulata]